MKARDMKKSLELLCERRLRTKNESLRRICNLDNATDWALETNIGNKKGAEYAYLEGRRRQNTSNGTK